MAKKKKELPNIIGSRKILKDLKEIADKKEAKARAALRMRDSATTRKDYEYWREVAITNHNEAQEIDAFIDIYRIF
ncbi:MAG: hypothetical protein LUD72_06945 [Bacteroidales bacterium]|nr:hypothetical protein [Bacteroidales bacterium]